jgi:hypothetical protein
MRFGPYPVKESPKQAETQAICPRWLEGWALVFPSVGIAVLGAWLALPQATVPDYLPQPVVSRSELTTARRQLLAEADGARKQPLPYEVRSVGEVYRQLGRLEHGGQPISIDRRNRFRDLVRSARNKIGDSALRQLRSIEAQLFVLALADWEPSGIESQELIELGGDFIAVASDLGWLAAGSKSAAGAEPVRGPRGLGLDDDERRALFLTRWNDLAGTSEEESMRLATVWQLLALRARLKLPLSRLEQRDLGLVHRVKTLLPDYPDRLSEGLIYLRIGKRTEAIDALQSHLQLHPDGPYTLRARNHLVFAVEKATSSGS